MIDEKRGIVFRDTPEFLAYQKQQQKVKHNEMDNPRKPLDDKIMLFQMTDGSLLPEMQEELDRINSFNDSKEDTIAREAILLYEQTYHLIADYEENHLDTVIVPEVYKQKFFEFIHRLAVNLMEDEDDFYSYFFFQMDSVIRFDLASPTGINFRQGHYVIYFNPLSFLPLTAAQMESSIKHEILHVVSLHLLRARKLEKEYSKLAINLAMDVVVNNYLTDLQPDAADLRWVNREYNIALAPFKTFEYYAEAIQKALDNLPKKIDVSEMAPERASNEEDIDESVTLAFNPLTTHDLWKESDEIEEKTLIELTEKYVEQARRGETSAYLESILSSLKESKEEIPWYWYLKKLFGSIAADKRRTTMRRNRRQPERLDLPGELRNRTVKITVAIDISGSISDEEFKQALEEVLTIVKNYKHEIVIVECDDEIRRTYKLNDTRDIQERLDLRGGTAFSPVIEYCNAHKTGLLIYFTDGAGEKALTVKPLGYEIFWVLTGRSNAFSLESPMGLVKRLKPIEIIEDTVTLADLRTSGFSMANQE